MNELWWIPIVIILALTVVFITIYADEHPNTVVTFCEWTTSGELVDCTEDRYWHDNDYNVIYEEHVTYQKLVSDL